MQAGLIVKIVEVDPDYLGLDIRATSNRFSGSTRIYAGLTDLTEFANRIAGFPTTAADERSYEFGRPDGPLGFCGLRFRCIDGVGHARVEVALQDDKRWFGPGAAEFSFPVVAEAVDRFTRSLLGLERNQAGEAVLEAYE